MRNPIGKMHLPLQRYDYQIVNSSIHAFEDRMEEATERKDHTGIMLYDTTVQCLKNIKHDPCKTMADTQRVFENLATALNEHFANDTTIRKSSAFTKIQETLSLAADSIAAKIDLEHREQQEREQLEQDTVRAKLKQIYQDSTVQPGKKDDGLSL